MILNETGLVRAMKEARKTGGYTVVGYQTEKGGTWIAAFAGGTWFAAAQRECVPRKVLGCIAECCGCIPGPNEAVLCRSKSAQNVIWAEAMGTVEDYAGQISRLGADATMKRTLFTYNGARIWQDAADLHIAYVNEDLAEIGDYTTAAWGMGKLLVQKDFDSVCLIPAYAPEKLEDDRVAWLLGKAAWVSD